MEMTFPHFAANQDSPRRVGLGMLLASVIARQANSQTVRVVRRAETAPLVYGDDKEQRIRYFARNGVRKMAVRGAFWRVPKPALTSEHGVYQAGSKNIKVRDLNDDGTGEQLNHAGHGALRKL